MIKLSVVIPVFNEGKNLVKLVKEIRKEKELLNLSNFELIIYKVANIGGEYKLEKIAC